MKDKFIGEKMTDETLRLLAEKNALLQDRIQALEKEVHGLRSQNEDLLKSLGAYVTANGTEKINQDIQTRN